MEALEEQTKAVYICGSNVAFTSLSKPKNPSGAGRLWVGRGRKSKTHQQGWVQQRPAAFQCPFLGIVIQQGEGVMLRILHKFAACLTGVESVI